MPQYQDYSVTVFEEIAQNTLRVVLTELITREEPEYVADLKAMVFPVTEGPDSKVYEFIWDIYVAYNVCNESYGSPLADEGARSETIYPLVTYAKSAYLEYVRATTFCSDDYPGPLQHWQLLCSNHIIDVVSVRPPVVRRLDRDDAEPMDALGQRH